MELLKENWKKPDQILSHSNGSDDIQFDVTLKFTRESQNFVEISCTEKYLKIIASTLIKQTYVFDCKNNTQLKKQKVKILKKL